MGAARRGIAAAKLNVDGVYAGGVDNDKIARYVARKGTWGSRMAKIQFYPKRRQRKVFEMIAGPSLLRILVQDISQESFGLTRAR
jgi:hypothetical protein